MDLTVVAYATLALSVFVSAVKMGGWILNADPRAIIGAGRWALALLPAAALALLGWLAASGRWTAAVLLAAFLLPVFVQAAPRWRVLFAPFNTMKSGMRPFAADLGGSIVPRDPSPAREPPDPELVAQAIAVLRAYLQHHTGAFSGNVDADLGFTRDQHSILPKSAIADLGGFPQKMRPTHESAPQIPQPARSQIEHRPADRDSDGARVNGVQLNGSGANGSGNGGSHMSTQEAFEVLGLKPTPSPREVKAAHRHLAQLLDPEQGGSPYLLAKIDEARDVLLGE
jgi:hypothetical protein